MCHFIFTSDFHFFFFFSSSFSSSSFLFFFLLLPIIIFTSSSSSSSSIRFFCIKFCRYIHVAELYAIHASFHINISRWRTKNSENCQRQSSKVIPTCTQRWHKIVSYQHQCNVPTYKVETISNNIETRHKTLKQRGINVDTMYFQSWDNVDVCPYIQHWHNAVSTSMQHPDPHRWNYVVSTSMQRPDIQYWTTPMLYSLP